MGDQDIRAALDRHWAASEAGDDDAEDEIYHDDAVLEYPQSGERIRGRLAIRTTRGLLPDKHFTIRRVLGHDDLWVTNMSSVNAGKPSYTVSIMEFRDGKVFRETQYFGDPFEPWSVPSGLNRSISRQVKISWCFSLVVYAIRLVSAVRITAVITPLRIRDRWR